MTLSVIIVNFNTREFLKTCLASVFTQTKDLNFEVWVVDNGSTDGSVDEVKSSTLRLRSGQELKVIENQENLGFARANNQALQKACGEFILLLNSDTVVLDKAIFKMVKFMEQNPRVGILGAKLLNPDETPQKSCGKFLDLWPVFLWLFGGERLVRFSPEKTTSLDWVSGACLMLRRDVLGKIGFLDEKFFMYLEEVEFCYRAKKMGLGVAFYPQAKFIHYERGSGGKPEAIWEIYKGLNYFYKKHKPFWQQKILKLMLKTKAALVYTLGVLTGNNYLRKTYGKAFSVAG